MSKLAYVLPSIIMGCLWLNPAFAETAQQEQHPHIAAALKEMRDARKELENAANNFGGHKRDAIRALDEAIKQLQLALEFRQQADKKR